MILDSDFDSALEELNSQPKKAIYDTNDLEGIANNILATLPKINRNAYRREMLNMQVRVSESPTTFELNEGLAKVQGYKDRLAEMYNLANNEYRLRKRTKEMLFDAQSVLSKASSADKRSGECTMKYPLMVLNLEAAEIFVDEIEQIMANMKSTSEAISRQVSVMQMALTIGDVRRGNQSEAQEVSYSSDKIKKTGEIGWDEI
jgi:ATP-dependent protease HslVU (ClpYQ) ATPase subunit